LAQAVVEIKLGSEGGGGEEEATTTDPIDWASATTTNRMLGSLNMGVTILITMALLGYIGYLWNSVTNRKKPWQK